MLSWVSGLLEKTLALGSSCIEVTCLHRRESQLQFGYEGYHNHTRNYQQGNQERKHPTPSHALTYHETTMLEPPAPPMSFLMICSFL
jgi:hypothetical protein